MNLIIPMAGIGKRMRPHTLTIPKPLLPIAGKPIVQRLAEDIVSVCKEPVKQIGFVINPIFGTDVEQHLLSIASDLGAEGKIFYQEEALGTAHAVYCADDILKGKSIIAFADTLFKADFSLDSDKDGIIWCQKVEDPSAYGVVKLDGNGIITDFIEKPKDPVSDLAIIGIYYLQNGEALSAELKSLIDQQKMVKGEYQLTDALEALKLKGLKMVPGQVEEWLDCGNKEVTVQTNQRYLELIKDQNLRASSSMIKNSTIIEPVFLGENVELHNSVVGPHVSVGEGTVIRNAVVQNSIIQTNARIENLVTSNSMVGNFTQWRGKMKDLSVGDYNIIIE